MPPDCRKAGGAAVSIEIRDLNFSYPGSSLLFDRFNLDVSSGQFVGIVGQTGCGKSTLLQMMAGLIRPLDGKIFIDKENILDKKYNRSDLRKKLGIVFQFPETQLFEQSVEKDIAFSLKHFDISKQEKRERIQWAMTLMGLDYKLLKDKSPLALSGGEKRRVAIAGVLVIQPKYLLLDEPVAGLDPIARDDFMHVLLELKNQGTTIIMVSHNSDCIAEYCDRALVMNDGRIVKDAKPAVVYSDCKDLKKMNLGVCSVRQTMDLLSEKGIQMSSEIIKYDDLLTAIVAEFKV